uniref:hypothetical protein n=1 Tax=Streptomyces sp. T028 TaxID=3394379 RepID=UPI003A89536D
LPSGDGHRWAETALDLAGFATDRDGIYQLPLDEPIKAREALVHLHQAARDCRATVITREGPYLGDIASVVCEGLPGPWEATIETFPSQRTPGDLLERMWTSGPLMSSLEKIRVPCAAILLDGAGTELLLVEQPGDRQYLVGALLPSPDHVNAIAPGPRSIIAHNAHLTAGAIRNRLLPEYEQAVHLSRLREVEDDLTWVQETFEPGTVLTPYPPDLDAALDRFLTHAPEFIATLRRPGGKPLTGQETAFLDRVEADLQAAHEANSGELSFTGSAAGAPLPVDAMELWLTEGEQLIEMARDITWPPPSTAPVPTRVRTTPPPAPPVSANNSALRR